MLTEGELRDWQEPAETEQRNWLDSGEEVGEGGWEGTQEHRSWAEPAETQEKQKHWESPPQPS